MAHHELVGPHKERFLNLVIRFHSDGIHFHFSGYRGKPSPTILLAETFETPKMRLEEYFVDAAKLLRQKDTAARQMGRGLLMAGFWGLVTVLGTTPKKIVHEHPTLVQCRQLVYSHISDPALSVASMADELTFSADYLSRLFHSLTGRTLSSYITETRVDHSKSLLKKSTLSIKEIAFASGYRSAGYFIRVFKRAEGVTPMEYRKGLLSGFVTMRKKRKPDGSVRSNPPINNGIATTPR